jgi:hypothetical protein
MLMLRYSAEAVQGRGRERRARTTGQVRRGRQLLRQEIAADLEVTGHERITSMTRADDGYEFFFSFTTFIQSLKARNALTQ